MDDIISKEKKYSLATPPNIAFLPKPCIIDGDA